jgi:hypothetical protein
MHEGSVTLFLVAVVVIAATPFVLLGVELVRRARTRRRSAPDETSRPRGPLRPLLVGLSAVVLLAVSIGWYLSAHPARQGADEMAMAGTNGAMPGMSRSDDPLPATLAGAPMTNEVTGPQAIRQIASLHGTDMPIESAEIGQYADGRLTVWMSTGADAAGAADMVVRMGERISGGGSPFTPPRPFAAEPGVWSTRGMGQMHFFFASGDAVWWLAADPGLARSALSELIVAAGP